MSDLERLAKIEARHNSVTSEDRIGPKRHAQYVLLHEDMPWLLARIRELEDEKNAVYDKWDADCQKQDARIRELEAQAELMVDVYKGADLPELVARVNAAEARVRELEARAALDAAVVEAASLVLKDIENEELDWDNTKQLDAALAARDAK